MRSAAHKIEEVRIGAHGEIQVPSRLLRARRLKKGSRMLVVEAGETILLVAPDPAIESTSDQLIAAFARRGVTLDRLLRNLPKVRKQLVRERYGDLR